MPALIAIDPGLGSTGWAYWMEMEKGRARPPDRFGLVTPRRDDEFSEWWESAEDRADDLWKAIEKDLKMGLVDIEAVCEMPIFFSGTSGGVAAAETNSLQKLCFLVGVYARMLTSHGVRFSPVTVRDWKGQLPKTVVAQRIIDRIGSRNCRGFKKDIWDAVGIGLYVKGVFR